MIAIEVTCSCKKKFTGTVGMKVYCSCGAEFEITTTGKGPIKPLPEVKAM